MLKMAPTARTYRSNCQSQRVLESSARAAGLTSIADIARQRIALAGQVIREEPHGESQDIGFRAYSLTGHQLPSGVQIVTSNPLNWNSTSLTYETAPRTRQHPTLCSPRSLEAGLLAHRRLGEVDVDGLSVHSVGDGLPLAYLDEHTKPTLEQLRAVVDQEPARLVILEDAFQGDDELKTNLAQLCKSKSVELWTA